MKYGKEKKERKKTEYTKNSAGEINIKDYPAVILTMKNEKISLDKLKEMKEVLENKNTLLVNPIMPTILGYSIKEIVDEFIKEKIKYEFQRLRYLRGNMDIKEDDED